MSEHSDLSIRPKIGLVLGSGGARGAAHIGVLRVLEELEIPIDLVVGASMGAIIGGAYAAGVDLAEREDERNKTDLIKMAKHLLPSHSFKYWTAGEGTMELFERYVGDVHIESLKIPYAAMATDIHTGKPFVIRKGRLADAMRASSSIPIIFAPVEKDEHCLVDGGLVNPLPVDVAKEMGAERIIAVDVNSQPESLLNPEKHSHHEKPRGTGTPDLIETISAMMILVQRQLAKHVLENTPADVYIEPSSYANLFGYRKFGEVIEAGIKAAHNKSDELKALLDS